MSSDCILDVLLTAFVLNYDLSATPEYSCTLQLPLIQDTLKFQITSYFRRISAKNDEIYQKFYKSAEKIPKAMEKPRLSGL